MFDPDQFIAECRAAVMADPTYKGVREVLARAVCEPLSVLKALGEPKAAGVEPLYRSPELTILNVVWGPMMTVMPHEHRMWAVIGRIAALPWLLAAALVATGPSTTAQGAARAANDGLVATPALVRDFMIQNVCLDAAGKVIEGLSPIDPGGRCTRQRDLLPGERLPYHKGDHPAAPDRAAAPEGYQRHDSFPVMTADFGEVVEDSFDFGIGEGRRFGVFDAGKGDGGDIVLFAPGTASIAATEDGGAGFQLFVGADCRNSIGPAALARSWIVALYAQGAPLQGETVARLADLRAGHQQSCPARLNAAYTRWQVMPVRYDAGVTLSTLVSDHYGGKRPDRANHVERFYFTRELGATRWERWQNSERTHAFSAAEIDEAAARLAASGRCSPAPPPKGGPFVMIDCREWTLIVPPEDPAGDRPGFFIDAIRRRHLAGGLFAAPHAPK